MKPTRTINRIHFSDLDPMRFEELCYDIINNQREWKNLNHVGRKGNDRGIDIIGKDAKNDIWYFQCKRYAKITINEIKNIVDKIKSSNEKYPDYLELFISCDISIRQLEKFKEFSNELKLKSCRIWDITSIESFLYKEEHNKLLYKYFGIQFSQRENSKANLVKQKLKIKKRIERDFINKSLDIDFIKNVIRYEPSCKFTIGELIIRNIDNDNYPSVNDDSEWFKAEIYDLYFEGLEIDLFDQTEIFVNEEGNWDLVNNNEVNSLNKYNVIKARKIGRIPFTNIIEYDFSGDEYHPYPNLYCRFNFNESPFESFEYYTYGDREKEITPSHFEINDRISSNQFHRDMKMDEIKKNSKPRPQKKLNKTSRLKAINIFKDLVLLEPINCIVTSFENKECIICIADAERKIADNAFHFSNAEIYFYKLSKFAGAWRVEIMEQIFKAEFIYCNFFEDFEIITINFIPYLYFNYCLSPMGNAINYNEIYFSLMSLKDFQQVTLNYGGIPFYDNEGNSKYIKGDFSNLEELNNKPEILNYLERKASKCSLIYRATKKDLELNTPENFIKKWKIDNPKIKSVWEVNENTIEESIVITFYDVSIFPKETNSIFQEIENDNYKIVAIFRNNILGYDKFQRKFFPIWVESCSHGCNKNISFIEDNILKITYSEANDQNIIINLSEKTYKIILN
ncbi:MAG: restriction endonuclease [Bacteroidota bacterium]